MITEIKNIHNDLVKCVRLVNFSFGFQCMLCIAVTFIFTLFAMFAAYKAFYHNEIAIKAISISSLFLCTFYNIFKMCVIICCNMVDCQAREMSTLIYKIINRNVCNSLVLQTFGNQVNNGQPNAAKAGCGLFYFDNSLIMMVRCVDNNQG